MASSASSRASRLFGSSETWARTSTWVLAGCLGWLAVQELLKLYWAAVARRRNSALASPTELVRATTREVLASAKLVSVSRPAVLRLAKDMTVEDLAEMTSPAAFDSSIHLCDGTWRTVQYLLVVDCLNFCFWPYGACGLLPLTNLAHTWAPTNIVLPVAQTHVSMRGVHAVRATLPNAAPHPATATMSQRQRTQAQA